MWGNSAAYVPCINRTYGEETSLEAKTLPQGSSLSPTLFLMVMQKIHMAMDQLMDKERDAMISYADDIALATADFSTSSKSLAPL